MARMSERLFTCAECGGDVFAMTGLGRTVENERGVVLPVPDDLAAPTCVRCGEEYYSVANYNKIVLAAREIKE